MTPAICLTYILFREASTLPVQGWHKTAEVVINRAVKNNITICEELNKANSYSFLHDNKPDNISGIEDINLLAKLVPLARKKLWQYKGNAEGYLYFNECKLGKKYQTKHKMLKIKNMCYY
jgi:hypothetical protein